MMIAWRVPESVYCENGNVFSGEELFLLLLHRFSYPKRFNDMRAIWGREATQLSRGFNTMVSLMFVLHGTLLLDNLDFFEPRFPVYNIAIKKKIRGRRGRRRVPAHARRVSVFVDGKLVKTC